MRDIKHYIYFYFFSEMDTVFWNETLHFSLLFFFFSVLNLFVYLSQKCEPADFYGSV